MWHMQSTREKVSYCIGLESAINLKQQFSDLDHERLMAGFRDALDGATPQLPDEEIGHVLRSLREQIEKQRKQFIAKVSEENLKQGEEFLRNNKAKEGVMVMPSGLQYKVLHSGDGASPTPTSTDTVSVHYRASDIEGRMFDDSRERGQPETLPINRMIPGWTEALKQMRVGDRWQLFVPPYLAYGEMGFGPHVGPNAVLVFEMELLSIHPE